MVWGKSVRHLGFRTHDASLRESVMAEHPEQLWSGSVIDLIFPATSGDRRILSQCDRSAEVLSPRE